MSAPIQNIVIIGASIAGGNLVNGLVPDLPGTYRILLIEALPAYTSWPIGSLRASVVPGWEKRVTAPVTTESVFPSGSQHLVLSPNKVVELRQSSVVVEKPFEGSTEIPFWKCIIATGASQPSPMRPVPGSTEAEYKEHLVKLQNEFKSAKKVVIIGAGSVGLELAGEIRQAHPDSSITIVHSLPHVLNPTAGQPDLSAGHFSYSSPPTALKLSKQLEGQLKELNINVITNDRVTIPAPNSQTVGDAWDGSFGLQSSLKKVKLDSGKTLDADFVFVSAGNKPNVSLVESADKGAIVAGLVGVDQYLKVVSKTANSILTQNYYAIGDCSSTPGWKTAQGAQADAAGAAVNILAELKKKPLKSYTRPKPYGMVIPLGTTTGAGTLELPLLGTVSLPVFMVKSVKAKDLFVEQLFFSRFKGAKKPQAPAIPAAA